MADCIHEAMDVRQYCVRIEKRPYTKNSYGLTALWKDQATWLSYPEACEILEGKSKVIDGQEVDGIGFLVTKNDTHILGGDLDCCRDPETGSISNWATEFVNQVQPFYTEVSPSKCGLRFFCHGSLGRDSVFCHGPQDDLSDETKERIEAVKPSLREKIEKGQPAFNGLEFYEDGPRHLTLTGERIDDLCFPLVDQTDAITEALDQLELEIPAQSEAREAAIEGDGWIKCNSLPHIDILDVIKTDGFSESGGQLFGPHPTLGSTTGRNLVVNPEKGVWAYMHNGINSGGDAWTWLACECGAVAWEKAGSGALNDPHVMEMVLDYALSKGLVDEDDVRSPRIRPVSDDDNVGCVGLYTDGTIKRVMIHKNGQKELEWISDCAVHIHTETAANGETELRFKGVGARDQRHVDFTLPADSLAEPRKFKAALLNAFGARNRIGHLDFETVQRMSLNPKMLRRVEVPAWDGSVPLVPGVGIAHDVEFKLSKMNPVEVYDGDLEEAKECLWKLIYAHEYAPILVATVLGAPAFARWHINDRFGLGIWGLTGTQKTSLVQAAMSVYGVGYLDDDALFKHGRAGGTQVAALEIFANAGFLPQILDNVKAVDPKDSQQYVAVIQAVIEGREKQRGRKDGGLRDAKTFACTPIITGEVRPEEASTSARILNLAWSEPILSNLSYVQRHVKAMPVIGYHWLKFLATTGLNLVVGFDEARSRKFEQYSRLHYTNPGRLATMDTLLRSVWRLACVSPMGDIFVDCGEGFEYILDQAIEMQGMMVTEETEISRFLNGLRELIASDPTLIMRDDFITGRRAIGKKTDEGIFLLPNETLKELTNHRVFTQQPTTDSMTKALDATGMLIHGDGGHLKAKVAMGSQRPRGWLLRGDFFTEMASSSE